MSGAIMPTVLVCLVLRLRATALGWYFNSRITLRTRSRRAGVTLEVPLMTCETVAVETWDRAAMSLIVAISLVRLASGNRRSQEPFCLGPRERSNLRAHRPTIHFRITRVGD